MRVLFLGDIVGKPGRRVVKNRLPGLIQELNLDLVIANAENAAGGFGLTLEVAGELFSAGIDVLTMGNHTWKNREIYQVFQRYPQVIRPANYPAGTPGEGYGVFTAKNGYKVGVINLLGQVYIEPPLECPFRVGEDVLSTIKKQTPYVFIDFHAEATSEKKAFGYFVDGKASAVLGTHTHITTADERILPGGTAYITDTGMCGPVESVLGIKTELAIKKFLTKLPVRFDTATGPAELNAVYMEWDHTGRTVVVRRINCYEK
ncbi:MAG TPA: TIGR00282 family metallophosphoesterase [Firmicutes bacterium]|nr:TIGR00282 family metallophosphoesterase [Bacillota bacterium]